MRCWGLNRWVLHSKKNLKYSPVQPRVPSGNPSGGEWTAEGGDVESGSRSGGDIIENQGSGSLIGGIDENSGHGRSSGGTLNDVDNSDSPDGNDSSDSGGDPSVDGGDIIDPADIVYDEEILSDMATRDWTPEQINNAVTYGDRIDAIDKSTGEPATRYVYPETGRSVVINNNTREVVQVGRSDFGFGSGSGDVPGAVMRPSPNGPPSSGGGGGLGPSDILRPGSVIPNPNEPSEE